MKFSKPSTSEDFILLPLTVLLLNETFTYFLPRGQIVTKQYSTDVKESIKFLCAKFTITYYLFYGGKKEPNKLLFHVNDLRVKKDY